MPAELIVLIIVFIAVLGLGVPVAVCLGLAAIVAIASIGDVPTGFLVAQRIATGIASFPLLAIPFFVLSGLLMGEGGMARRLINFAAALVGRLPGGLAYVTTTTCMLFGAVSGSAVAAVSSIGSFMIPQMTSKGFGRDFSVALTVTSATTGLIIPPSNIMIVYAVVAGNVSVAALFMAGFVPGILMGLCIMAAALLYNVKTGNQARMEPPPLVPSLVAAVPSMLLIVIVLGGILGGVFSATEASAVAVAYALLLGVGWYREIPVRKLPDILLRSSKTTAVVMLLIGTSQAMSWALSYERVPQTAGEALLGLSENPVAILMIINVLLLAVGTFMDMTPATLIFTPILLPAVMALGVDPVHFGIMAVMNIMIGLVTPPYGLLLFMMVKIAEVPLRDLVREVLPFLAVMIAALALITFVPDLVLFLPRLLGYKG
jgi:tripartite ATP-independent transporter DctM subunit